jgi:hypothetical protein
MVTVRYLATMTEGRGKGRRHQTQGDSERRRGMSGRFVKSHELKAMVWMLQAQSPNSYVEI